MDWLAIWLVGCMVDFVWSCTYLLTSLLAGLPAGVVTWHIVDCLVVLGGQCTDRVHLRLTCWLVTLLARQDCLLIWVAGWLIDFLAGQLADRLYVRLMGWVVNWLYIKIVFWLTGLFHWSLYGCLFGWLFEYQTDWLASRLAEQSVFLLTGWVVDWLVV